MSNISQWLIGILFLMILFMVGVFLLELLKQFFNYLLDRINLADTIKLERKKIIAFKEQTDKQLSLLEMKANDMAIENEKHKKVTEKWDVELVSALDECFTTIDAVSATASSLAKKVELILQEGISDEVEILKLLKVDIQNINLYNDHLQELNQHQMEAYRKTLKASFKERERGDDFER